MRVLRSESRSGCGALDRSFLENCLENRSSYINGGSIQKMCGGLKYSAPNINLYVVKILTACSLKINHSYVAKAAPKKWTHYSVHCEYKCNGSV